jgi:hypothetical protein
MREMGGIMQINKDSFISAADALTQLANSTDGQTTYRCFLQYEKELREAARFLRLCAGKEPQIPITNINILGRYTRF